MIFFPGKPNVVNFVWFFENLKLQITVTAVNKFIPIKCIQRSFPLLVEKLNGIFDKWNKNAFN